MLLSMTAFGNALQDCPEGKITVEVRCVNHRYLDVSIRAPEEFRALDNAIRQRIAKRMNRGKIECSLRFERALSANEDGVAYDAAMARRVVDSLRAIAKDIGHDNYTPDPARVLAWPGVQSAASLDIDSLHTAALATVDDALSLAVDSRRREGASISTHLSDRVNQIADIVEQLRARRPTVLAEQQQRLRTRLSEIDATVDPGRVEQELVIAAQKLDIDEELDRLGTHVSAVTDILEKDKPAGRRLDFLMQEFNREANTVASKASDSETTALAVDLKVLIEQMREQVQNVE
ncbi:MAG: YicC/YloC family endoribonuclease [Pseudomonadota bacterium]